MKRSGFARPTAEGLTQARLNVPVFRPKKCDTRKGGCGHVFTPARAMQKACSPRCAERFADHIAAKKAAALARNDSRQIRAALEAIKTLPMLKREAEAAMNRYVRLRDFNLGCISCGASFAVSGARGGNSDAGHFRSKGSAPHLRFDERNVHGQCKRCNQYLAGNHIGYEVGLIARIGAEAVQQLKTDEAQRKFTRDDLRSLRDHYRALVRQKGKE